MNTVLCRRFGVEDAKRRIKELRAIWISHRHADHHVGVSRVLALRRQLLPADVAPLPVFGPPPLRRVLSACNKLEAMHYTWIDQYCICPQEQGKGRDLQYCWEHASKFDAGPIVKAVCEVRCDSRYLHIETSWLNLVPCFSFENTLLSFHSVAELCLQMYVQLHAFALCL